LKIISLKEDRPHGWAGKTWALQQGYLCSNGHILIFTDADTYYSDQDTINSSISYFQNENLDVLTGFPFIELLDFWSKVVNPVWKLIGTLFGCNLLDINNPKSDAANLMGCFIMIKRKIFEEIGTYQQIRNNIREDEALGVRAKQLGYKIGAVRMDKSMTALWSKDLQTLWNGISRTIVPDFLNPNGKKKEKVIHDLLIIFFIAILPFVTLPYSLNKDTSSAFDYYIVDIFHSSDSAHVQSRLINQIHLTILLLNLSACVALFAGSAANAILIFKISPIHAFMSPIGAIFLFVAYITNIFALIIQPQKLRTVVWRDRNICVNNKKY
jgi:cellulose synthase/poly-beta-1,6-N-acetylglucosamine synthase-like glycosyltransferase